ncbi:MAG TPA: hypothetical protein VEA60_06925, partial [Allosphingosinicella sp.]|nr:hypothetical protein [Allosphingosinicella sp.]
MAAIIGTEGPDTLVETIAVDTIEGLGGDDVIILDKGQTTFERDEIDGGAGSDRLVISRSVAGIEVFAFGPPGSTATIQAGSYANVRNVEHYTIYHLTGEGTRDFIFTGAGDDVYYFTATNNGTPQSEPNQVDLGSGQNDLLSIDASSVFDFGVEIAPISSTRYLVWVGSAQRINFINIERLEFVGSALNDRITGLSGNDIIDGRGGNDTLIGVGGNDLLAGGVGDDMLDGGDGNDVLTFTTGSDTIAGGNGTDRLVLDARSVSGSVVLFLGGNPGPTYSGALTYAAG